MLKQLMADKAKEKTLKHNEYILPLVPTNALIMGPYVTASMDMFKGKILNAVTGATRTTRLVVFADRITQKEEPLLSDLRSIGTLCDVTDIMRLTRETTRVNAEGKNRVIIKDIIAREPYLMAKIELLDNSERIYSLEEKALYSILKDKFAALIALSGRADEKLLEQAELKQPDDGCDYILANSPVTSDEFYSILECLDTKERIKQLIEHLDMALRTANLEIEIETKVATNFAEEQKTRYLREKKEMIDKELGTDDDAMLDDYRKRIEQLPVDEEYKVRLMKEMDRFETTPIGSQESSVIQSYFDCVLDLPWNDDTKPDFNIKEAAGILDEDHYGLEKVKERILEYLAVIKLTDSLKSPILCLVGPPGVGKTSVAKSVARATNRKFTRLSLGGMHDEAEIRGHRKTYVGAMPGRIIAGLRQVQSKNPVFLLDEIDKLSKDYKGDPSSALLEALDPEQNSTFTDNYVEIPFDLSDVLFITTANTLSTIPEALLDRLEVLELSGYLPDEKLEIAKRHLIRKQLEANGVSEKNIDFSDEILNEIIDCYTRESGVRQLERSIASLCRKAAKTVVDGENVTLELTKEKLRTYLGPKVHTYDIASEAKLVGTVCGLAWTSAGGDTLQIEAAFSDGNGKLELTGHLGDVMKESAKAAIGYLRANGSQYGIKSDIWEKSDIHIHVPEGAVPKDGPSAGITITTSLISSLTKTPVPQDIAMTGEITLTGRVLPIGGLREKLLAATRAQVKRVILPKENENDIEDVPEKVREKLDIHYAESMNDVYRFAFGEA